MKNAFKVLGIIVVTAVIVFSMVSCGDDDGGGGNAVIGAKLELSGQVYTSRYNDDGGVTYVKYEGNLTISDNNGGNATITNGKLSYTIETPDNFVTWDELQSSIFSGIGYDAGHKAAGYDVKISDPSTKCFILRFYKLYKENDVYKEGKTSSTETSESVTYVYVDKDVNITGKGETVNTFPYGISLNAKTNNFSLALKEGWNAIYSKHVYTENYSSDDSDDYSVKETETISLNNPSLKWVYRDMFGR